MLIDDVKTILDRLSPHGWDSVFQAHGLNIGASNLNAELTRQLTSIDRQADGFFDLAPACVCGAEPGSPSLSLLFHALASPNVFRGSQGDLTAFPTLAELDIVENYIYSLNATSLGQLRQRARGLQQSLGMPETGELAVVMMATEYRGANDTVHQLHADFLYSRTGVARAGTNAANYIDAARGYWPASNSRDIHVVPCVWKPFICTRVQGTNAAFQAPDGFGPMTPIQSDIGQDYWVPIHKLFDGGECIASDVVSLTWSMFHENSKIARIHRFFGQMNVASHVGSANLDAAPYTITDDIAEFASSGDLPDGTVLPTASGVLVKPARDNAGRLVSFTVPRTRDNSQGTIRHFWSSLELRGRGGRSRPVPEYVHIRHLVRPDGSVTSLNDDPAMMQQIRSGQYQALHYLDFTGAGFVSVSVGGLSEALDVKPGFSIVAAPDFYPMVDQNRVLDWFQNVQRDNPAIGSNIGWGAPPMPLSTLRFVADPNLADGAFRPFAFSENDGTQTTISAVIAQPGIPRSFANTASANDPVRCPVLPDSAAGVFAPGWAISLDTTGSTQHLSAYGLGSPFPEDSKLCAALSAFWPAAAPDTTRTYDPNRNSTAPMVDSEITLGNPWDGIDGISFDPNTGFAEFPDQDFADYVESAINNQFDIRETAAVTFDEYVQRVFRTAQVRNYLSLSTIFQFADLVLVSFTKVGQTDPVLDDILSQTGHRINGETYRFVMGSLRQPRRLVNDHKRQRASTQRVIEFVAGDDTIVHRENGFWESLHQVVFV